jgi:hypothetical protein
MPYRQLKPFPPNHPHSYSIKAHPSIVVRVKHVITLASIVGANSWTQSQNAPDLAQKSDSAVGISSSESSSTSSDLRWVSDPGF